MPASGIEESDVPLRSHGCLSLNRALMAALVTRFVGVFGAAARVLGDLGPEPDGGDG